MTDTLKTMTKAELIILLQKRHAEIEAMRLELAIARADKARDGARRSITPGHLAYREQCARARAEAMATGHVVRVVAPNSGATK